jgi:hypothetical protein
MAKDSDFGGLPKDDFDALVLLFGGTARPAGMLDPAWITELEKKVKVFEALAKEEHAAANAGEIDLIAVVMAAIEVRNAHKGAVGGPNVPALVNTLAALQALWNAP